MYDHCLKRYEKKSDDLYLCMCLREMTIQDNGDCEDEGLHRKEMV